MVVVMSEPAFPLHAHIDRYKDGEHTVNEGMSLRDYFAAKALQGILTNGGWVSMYVETVSKDGPLENMSLVAELLCDDVYSFADAMLKVRGE
jgi:hypothetical protein